MFKIENLLSRHIFGILGPFIALAAITASLGCGGVTTAAKASNSTSALSVQVTPSTVSVQTGSTQQFSATVSGGATSNVTWSATGGSITADGLYTAPATPGSYVVQATSTTDTSVSGSATVTVLGSSTSPQILFSPAQLSFGTIAVGATSTQNLKITNAGAGTLTVSQLNFTGDDVFSVSGVSFPISIGAGKSATVAITFTPTGSGSFTAALSANSNASNSSSSITVSGSGGSSASNHSVSLNWNASTSSVIGYFVYRGTVSGGPYTRLIANADAATTYTDSNVQSGATYYYVVTAVNGNGQESGYSNQVTAAVPTP